MVSSSSNFKLDEESEIKPSDPFVRRAIQSVKEVVQNHSDSDIFATLKEFNMDLDGAAQKLLNQDTFHEVKRKRDKKKESITSKGPPEPRRLADQNTTLKGSSELKKVTEQSTSVKGFSEPRKFAEHTQGMKFRTFSDRNARRGSYVRNSLPDTGINREFRVVRDNRVNQSINNEIQPASVQSSTSTSVQEVPYVSGRSTMKNPFAKKHIGPRNSEGQKSFQALNGPSELVRGQVSNSNNTNRKGVLEESRAKTPNTVSSSQGMKPHSSQPSATLASTSSVVGLYSSSSDPVHVPSNSRIPGTAGAIKREVGVVGIRRPSGNSVKHSTVPSSSVSTSFSGKDISPISETAHPSSAVMKSDQVVLTSESESVVANKSLSSNQYVGKTNQLAMGHQKAPQPNMEWKPKSSQKPSFVCPVIGTTAVPVSHLDDNSTDSKEADHLEENLSRVSISEIEHVIIPQHLRAPEADRTRLMFGSFGMEFESTNSISSGFEGLTNQQQFNVEPSTSVTAPSTSSEDVNQVDLLNGQVRNSGSVSPASIAVSENPSIDKREYANPGNLESYADIGMVQNNNPSYTLAESQQQQDFHGLPSFVAYDSQTGYDMPFFRPVMDDSLRSQSVPSPGEALSSHMTNSVPTSSVAMVQQQPIPQMYPQVHVSHFPNYMPYRQFLSPVYVPPMAMPGYSGNPAYPHPSNGNSYLLMPGGGSHLAAGGLKYGATQYKPIPPGAPTGFGSYSNPTGYALNGPGTVGGATGLEDPTRMKYKDGNLYVPSPQAETSEVWIQTPREIPGLQSAPYYNIPGQHPHAAYMPPHSGHPSFNGAATAQPTHVQFPGLYHPSAQQAAIASPHHMVPGMGSNVGVGVAAAAPGTQIGAYQQPQLGHLNWNTNF
ncbi:putative dentin sialophosphoprotein [Thalictrum thalictroides]|uniref:Putative dentin sialophosphoprotein n=1 Tax=Thalictrum thalictroides TaxID=46969 RepID=A0A7J6URT9_THATH|nr:putative dentin sialophosphoprotein [Thalictrum thalictroides]